MSQRPVLRPTAEYPISLTRTGRHVTVRIHGEIVAETDDALTLLESGHDVVHYIPFDDVRQEMLTGSDTTSYCPFKGDAGYFGVRTSAGATVADAIWTYRQPFEAVAAIAGHVAFYPAKAEIIVADG